MTWGRWRAACFLLDKMDWMRAFRGPRGRIWRWVALAAGVAALGLALGAIWLVRPYWQIAGQFGKHPYVQPSRLYGRPLQLVAGEAPPVKDLVAELHELGYFPPAAGEELCAGRYQSAGHELLVYLRSFPTSRGVEPPGRLEIFLDGRRIDHLRWRGKEVRSATLEPPLLATFWGDDERDRRPVGLDQVPEQLVRAVLAAEDDRFFQHGGLSLTGILRAAWVNLRGGAVRQGGSTLTQQLVKNLYLTQERTLERKAREAVLALFLDWRYDKRAILEAYLNEIYWGQSGPANLIGVGAVSRALFAKEPADLTLAESALLAGMIRSPGEYWPLTHPERALQRRNWVLDRMAELRWVERAVADAAKAAPLGVHPLPVAVRRAPYFVDAALAETARRFGVANLDDQGYALLSTLSWPDERQAEEAVANGLKTLEAGPEKRHAGQLQSALVSLDPRSGEVLAYVGGRDYRKSQFDRAGQALRQAGSAFKPVVYATAFEDGVASPSTLLDDEPLTVTLANMTWTPQNDDDQYLGWVTARQAVEQSRNVPTARLALQVGLPRIVAMARGLGITTPLQPVPALALGAFEVTPIELAGVYATLANRGLRAPVHGMVAVLDRAGEIVPGSALPEAKQVVSEQTAYLITSVLEGVLDRGTAASVRGQGFTDALAGKTGTTNGRRDTWFAGYAPSRATLVWVGYDDNSETRVSGARAALPIWMRFTAAVRPASGYPMFPQPGGIETAAIDPESGELATERCPQVITEVFLQGHVPTEVCHLHRRWFTQVVEQPPAGAKPGAPILPADRVTAPAPPSPAPAEEHGFRAWLRRVFGGRPKPQPLVQPQPEPSPPGRH